MSSFDTLKAAKSLQNAGFEVQQAEAVVGMVTYALSEGLATKDDVRELSGGLGALENKVVALDSKIDVLDSKILALDNKIDNSVVALESKISALNTRFEAVDTRFEAVDTRFEALDTKLGVLDSKFDALNAKIDTGLSDVTQKLVIYLGGIIVGVTTLLGVLSRIFPVVPAP